MVFFNVLIEPHTRKGHVRFAMAYDAALPNLVNAAGFRRQERSEPILW